MEPRPIPATQIMYGIVIVPAPIVAAIRLSTEEFVEPGVRKDPHSSEIGSTRVILNLSDF